MLSRRSIRCWSRRLPIGERWNRTKSQDYPVRQDREDDGVAWNGIEDLLSGSVGEGARCSLIAFAAQGACVGAITRRFAVER